MNESIPIQFFEKHVDKLNWIYLSQKTGIVKQEIRKNLVILDKYRINE